ncbi:MAG: hypothetical protein OQK12_05895 [Motiliproteus sp.]|nr:hypothetical protein [Motiliproteus sp.]MCW9050966.1 hypothetical protein [Motiliproteus sp.]
MDRIRQALNRTRSKVSSQPSEMIEKAIILRQNLIGRVLACRDKAVSLKDGIVDSTVRLLDGVKRKWHQFVSKLDHYGVKLTYVLKLHKLSAILITLLLACVGSMFLASSLDTYFSTPESFKALGAVLLTLGGALVGVTAIAFSLVMFALQVNVERLPYVRIPVKMNTDSGRT